MPFWGVEVKPGKPYTHRYDETRGSLRITQATLGSDKLVQESARTVVQCNVGNASPVLICSFLPDKNESCHLELEFDEQEEVVLSVLGQRSVHLTGYFIGDPKRGSIDSEEANGEDIADTESDDDYDNNPDEDKYESDFIDDDDIDGLPKPQEKKSAAKRRMWQVIDSDEEESSGSKKNKQKNKGNKKGKIEISILDEEESKKEDKDDHNVNEPSENVSQREETKKKKKKKNKNDKKESNPKQEKNKQPLKVQIFQNGLRVEEISTGPLDGPIALLGSKVYVNYVGKLQNGTTFESNVGQKPIKFRIGKKNQVIEGLDIGVEGMRVGDKRRLTIPPTLGYGDTDVEDVPKNSWLDFEVELVKMK